MSNKKKLNKEEEQRIHSAIRIACQKNFGVLDTNFLCHSLSVLDLKPPLCVKEGDSLEMVVGEFRSRNIGSVIVLDEAGQVSGIFTERDFISRALPAYETDKLRAIKDFMTPNPITQPPEITIAFALNLMSHGGFRHIPVVDQDGFPIGIVSVRDVMDFIVNSFVDDLLNFETEIPNLSKN